MIHRCASCPPQSMAEDYLLQQLKSEGEELQDPASDTEIEEEAIEFQQWTTVDRSELVRQSLPVTEFIALLLEKLNNLTAHSYIAKSQAKYLKKCKNDLRENEAIILGDFAENYKLVIQDEVQGYHWNQQSCTLHPIVIYHRQGTELKEHSLCFISDDHIHDTPFVYKVMTKSLEFIKEKICKDPAKVSYFSDGCAGQYKNCKNFIN